MVTGLTRQFLPRGENTGPPTKKYNRQKTLTRSPPLGLARTERGAGLGPGANCVYRGRPGEGRSAAKWRVYFDS